MDHSKYWLQTRSMLPERPALGPRVLHAISAARSFYCAESWEERAFAEDSAGLLGGCTWPPRSYTCSFCRREFRSAQALGGHMNVHRRDRARLKQSTSSGSEGTATTDHDHHRSPCKASMSASDCHRISLACDTEPASNPSNYTSLMASSLSSNNLVSPSFSSSETQEKHVDSNYDAQKNVNQRYELKHDENLRMSDADYFMPRYPCRGDEEIVSIKRQRIGWMFPFFVPTAAASADNISSIQLERQTEVIELSTSAVEELDLELRLGCSSNCKAVLC